MSGQTETIGEPADNMSEDLAADEASRRWSEHDKRVRRFLLRLSLVNWAIAIVAWTISAYLGTTSPARIFVYSVLFVIGLIAVIIAILTYLLEKFGHEASPPSPGEEEAAEEAPEAVASSGEGPGATEPAAVAASAGAAAAGAPVTATRVAAQGDAAAAAAGAAAKPEDEGRAAVAERPSDKGAAPASGKSAVAAPSEAAPAAHEEPAPSGDEASPAKPEASPAAQKDQSPAKDGPSSRDDAAEKGDA
jgi:hypothetical protein